MHNEVSQLNLYRLDGLFAQMLGLDGEYEKRCIFICLFNLMVYVCYEWPLFEVLDQLVGSKPNWVSMYRAYHTWGCFNYSCCGWLQADSLKQFNVERSFSSTWLSIEEGLKAQILENRWNKIGSERNRNFAVGLFRQCAC